MKVTALIEDDLVEKIKEATGGRNITDSITIALKEYLSNRNIDKVIDEIEREPFVFNEDMAAYGIRNLNRNR
ncbi:MAG: DUF2191 domain-containing protein [Marinoscillum sp.]|uniref:DUF2191 domain-containing protein n=1 Tax=Marinoscillum sp. TaxID=2024838 RepID=UPI0032F4979E